MRSCVTRILRCRRGATSVEYAILAGLMAIAVVGAFTVLNEPLQGLFTDMSALFDIG